MGNAFLGDGINFFKDKPHVVPDPPAAIVKSEAPVTYGRQFERLFPGQPCFYCGGTPNSVDRVIPKSRGGASIGNLVPCCFRCNQMKGNMTRDEFVAHMRLILETLEKKGVIQAGELIF